LTVAEPDIDQTSGRFAMDVRIQGKIGVIILVVTAAKNSTPAKGEKP
jgi:hypothetical protein